MRWIVAVITVEAVVEILVHSPLFARLRRLAPPLFECGWCLSVWIAVAAFGLVVAGLWWIMIPFVIARISNVFHEIFMRLRG